ncbi:MAG: 4Fe-4S dicluster domain-containing protein [Dehalococcoidia bacterium]|nr:MAG: 4Fe-4S dicluster domain-containing protein [Dehalococcoidia bacterium]
MGLKINREECTGCSNCVPACPFGLLEVVDDVVRVKEGCTLCGACVEACPANVLSTEEAAPAAQADLSYQGIWVFAEQHRGQIKGVAYELLARARELADSLKTEVGIVYIGSQLQNIASLAEHGADKVYLVESPELADFHEDAYAGVLCELIGRYRPEIVICGATALGRSFLPQVAARLKVGLTADCTALDIDADRRLLRQTRPTFGGNIMATIICPEKRPQMATVRPRVFIKGKTYPDRKGEIIRVDLDGAAVTSKTKLLEFIEDVSEKINLDEADIIVSGGRGLGKAENFALLKELANLLGAALGSSRPPVDEGWLPYSHQVGQTGKTVSPKLYIACGISGSVQHMAGMQTSDVIVAINDDPGAPIFEIATYGIVGDLFKVVPLMIEKLKGQK